MNPDIADVLAGRRRWCVPVGDCREVLASMPDGSARCCVTSPPYWGLRDYGTAKWDGGDAGCDHKAPPRGSTIISGSSSNKTGPNQTEQFGEQYRGTCGKCGAVRIDNQIGLESTPEEYVAAMAEVFREVRRVLADDGTLWLNLGSSYFGGGGFCPDAPSSATSKSGKYGNAGALIAGHSSGGRRSSQSRHAPRALSCGTDGTALLSSLAAGLSCPCCGGELQDGSLIRRDYTARTFRQTSQAAPPPSLTGRDSERLDSDAASQTASLDGATRSTTLASSQRDRAACVPAGSASERPSTLRTSPHCVLPSSDNSVCTIGTETPSGAWASGTLGTGLFCLACGYCTTTPPFKPKDLVPIPWMVAMALQADGWWLRQDIIWAKPNPMPESVTDRCTKAHEYVFLLAKAERYFYDADAIAEKSITGDPRPAYGAGQEHAPGCRPSSGTRSRMMPPIGGVKHADAVGGTYSGEEREWPDKRNARSVWSISPKPFAEAHFAVMPEALADRCVRAGSAVDDIVIDPFNGAGTTGLVSVKHGRRYVGPELNPAYADIARRRIAEADTHLFAGAPS